MTRIKPALKETQELMIQYENVMDIKNKMQKYPGNIQFQFTARN